MTGGPKGKPGLAGPGDLEEWARANVVCGWTPGGGDETAPRPLTFAPPAAACQARCRPLFREL